MTSLYVWNQTGAWGRRGRERGRRGTLFLSTNKTHFNPSTQITSSETASLFVRQYSAITPSSGTSMTYHVSTRTSLFSSNAFSHSRIGDDIPLGQHLCSVLLARGVLASSMYYPIIYLLNGQLILMNEAVYEAITNSFPMIKNFICAE